MEILFAFFLLLYSIFTLIMYLSWRKIDLYSCHSSHFNFPSVSIIIPVRNEGDQVGSLLHAISCQEYPHEKFEVIVVDDNSTDDTWEKVLEIQEHSEIDIKLVKANPLKPGYSAKKNALETGISQSISEVIVCTDGDCRVGKYWLSSLCGYIQQHNAVFVSGPVTFTGEASFFEKIQTIEFSSLIGAGAATLSIGIPTMCNGANLAFTREAFYEVNGYRGNETIASGDDEFLMHKLYGKYPGKVVFLKASEAIVYTSAKKSISEFVQQRKRWAGKWNSYQQLSTQLVAVFIFLVNIISIYWMIMSILGFYSIKFFIPFMILKIFTEFVFLSEILKFLGKKLKVLHFLLLEFLYPYYVSFFGIFSKIGMYEWKGRKWK